MFATETKIRVRYGETDKMGYVYYGNYPLYYEVGRSDMIRKLGWSYSKMEEEGIIMPVLELNVKYIRPAFYDNELTVKTIITELPSTRIKFDYELYNEDKKLINKGNTTLVFVNEETKKPISVPETLINSLKDFF